MTKPVCVMLHGLLGSKNDWRDLISHISDKIDCVAFDLPYHGVNPLTDITNLADVALWLDQKLQPYKQRKMILLGYSLGGRIALYYSYGFARATLRPHLLILEGAHLGLSNQTEKQGRWQHDQHWADIFRTTPIEEALAKWYQQPVFSSLSEPQRQQLIAERSTNDGKKIAQMLLATSLSQQPDFTYKITSQMPPIHYFCGEKDTKFYQLAQTNHLRPQVIERAGHNAHRDNPALFAKKLITLLE